MASGWFCPLSYWNWWSEGKPVGSNSGPLWSISATQKPIAPAPSLAQTQRAPSLHPAAATCSPCTEDGGWCPAGTGGNRLLAGTGSIRLLSYSALCSIASWSSGALCSSWSKPGNEKDDKAQEIFLCEQKGCGDYYCALLAQKILLERIETV